MSATQQSPWSLAIDFGTTTTAAAMTTRRGAQETIEIDGARRMPSTVFLKRAEGVPSRLVVGDVAENAAETAPQYALRAPKERIANDSVLLGAERVSVIAAVAAILSHVISTATARQGGAPPTTLYLTHPARWGKARTDKLLAAAAQAGYPGAKLVLEPVAAAAYFTSELAVRAGEFTAVYDLGGGTFDTAVLERAGSTFEVRALGGFDDLGGEDFDDRLYQFVGSRLDPESWRAFTSPDADTYTLQRHQRFRQDLRRAKERLSIEPEATVVRPLENLPDIHITRADFEPLIANDIERSVSELRRTIEQTGKSPADMTAIFLAGGSSQIPLVSSLIEKELGVRPRKMDDPKAVTALGALSSETSQGAPEVPKPPSRMRDWRIFASVGTLLAIVVAVAAISASGGSSPGAAHGGSAPSTTPTTPSTPSTPSTPTTPSTPSTPSTPTTPSTPSTRALTSLPTHCSTGLTATKFVSCGLASNLFYEYYKAAHSGGDTSSLSAWSHDTQRYYDAGCAAGGGVIFCYIVGTGDPHAQVQITQAALNAYSPQQASSYASQADIGPNG